MVNEVQYIESFVLRPPKKKVKFYSAYIFINVFKSLVIQ
jgi:hypothetical protein